MKKVFLGLTFILVSFFFITSCNEDGITNKGKGSLNFSFEEISNSGSRISSDSLPKSIIISIKDSEGEYILNVEKLSLFKIGDEYFTENLEFEEGSYTIEDFAVLNSEDSTIYLTPKSGSEFEDLVSTPLPFSFTISKDEISEVILDVVPANIGDADQFGYATFSFNIINVVVIQPDSLEGKDAGIGIMSQIQGGDFEDARLYAWTQSGELNVLRYLIDFDLSEIPDGVTIDSAYVSFYFNPTSKWLGSLDHSGHYGSVDFKIQKVIEEWHEMSVWWDNQPATTSTNEVLVANKGVDTVDYNHINITAIISDLYQNPDQGYGMMLKFQSETAYKVLYLASTDHPDPALRPKLVVYYH